MNILIFDEDKERREFISHKLQSMSSLKPVICNPIETDYRQVELFDNPVKKIAHSGFPQMYTVPYDVQITEKDIILVNATTYAYTNIANNVAEEKLLPFLFTQSNRFVESTHEFPIIVGVHDLYITSVIDKKDEVSLTALTNRLYAICKKIMEQNEFIKKQIGTLGYYKRYIGTSEFFKEEKTITPQLFPES